MEVAVRRLNGELIAPLRPGVAKLNRAGAYVAVV